MLPGICSRQQQSNWTIVREHIKRSVRCNGEVAEGLYRLTIMANGVDAVVLAALFELRLHAEGLEDVANFPLGHTIEYVEVDFLHFISNRLLEPDL